MFRNYGHAYVRGIMTVYFSSTVNPEDAIYATTLYTVDSIKALNDSYQVLMLKGRHRHRFVKIIQNDDGLEYASIPLHMRYVFCVDDRAISRAQSIKVRKITIVFTAIV